MAQDVVKWIYYNTIGFKIITVELVGKHVILPSIILYILRYTGGNFPLR